MKVGEIKLKTQAPASVLEHKKSTKFSTSKLDEKDRRRKNEDKKTRIPT